MFTLSVVAMHDPSPATYTTVLPRYFTERKTEFSTRFTEVDVFRSAYRLWTFWIRRE